VVLSQEVMLNSSYSDGEEGPETLAVIAHTSLRPANPVVCFLSKPGCEKLPQNTDLQGLLKTAATGGAQSGKGQTHALPDDTERHCPVVTQP
jgi:hypothetical protein